MVEEGLVERTTSAADGRGVVIALSEAGLARLMEAVPVHVNGVSRLFIERFDDQELEFLQRALEKVTLSRSFG
jgi:DNA-binding MarR family transcriptional regulator